MTTDQLRQARAICERAFSFLVTDFGYRKVRGRFQWGGFELGYRGPGVGVLVEWYPRDPLTVWLVRLEDGKFPPRDAVVSVGTRLHYFDLGDLEVLKTGHRVADERQLYAVPAEATARMVADSLRRCGADLLRGDLSDIPQLEGRIRARAAAAEALRRTQPQ